MRRTPGLPRVPTAAALADLAHAPPLRPFTSTHDDLFADGVATPELWAHLKSWKRHLPDGTAFLVCRGFGALLLFFIVDALFVTLYFDLAVPRLGWPTWRVITEQGGGSLPLLFNLTSFALALLLVFRTNGATARWWEARCAWGSTVNAARNLGRLLGAWLDDGSDETAAAARWVEALPWCMKAHLGGTPPGGLADELAGVLTPEEVDWLVGSAHRPQAAACALEALIAAASRTGGPLPPEIASRAAGEVSVYINAVGACERISRTAMPLSYTRSTSRYLVTWLTFLPLGVVGVCGWATPAVQGLIAFLLLSLENVAVHYEEGCGNLPMAAFCVALAANVRETAALAGGAARVVASGGGGSGGGGRRPPPKLVPSDGGGGGPAPAPPTGEQQLDRAGSLGV
jgi:ion channel-forming bestrophin family protein